MSIKSYELIVNNCKFVKRIDQLVRNSIMPTILWSVCYKIKRDKNSSNYLIFMEHFEKQEYRKKRIVSGNIEKRNS